MASRMVCQTLQYALCHFQQMLRPDAAETARRQSVDSLRVILPDVAGGLRTLVQRTRCKELLVVAVQQLLRLNIVVHAIQLHDDVLLRFFFAPVAFDWCNFLFLKLSL